MTHAPRNCIFNSELTVDSLSRPGAGVIHVAPNQITEWSGRATMFPSSLLCSHFNILATLSQVEDLLCPRTCFLGALGQRSLEQCGCKVPGLKHQISFWCSAGSILSGCQSSGPGELRGVVSELAADLSCKNKCLLKYLANQQHLCSLIVCPRCMDVCAKGL